MFIFFSLLFSSLLFSSLSRSSKSFAANRQAGLPGGAPPPSIYKGFDLTAVFRNRFEMKMKKIFGNRKFLSPL
ncbi:hypothetical protein OP10G_3323 [Fimbriimonas ginsengisoli Gsoil 348]|uniref:Secreted protein n=1 Tax=Fimbriimonas ginsengisoli Gsoil 348 TaxID=661478 RepID=A0A068NTD0_FIMGI|nr:hypothetical protein OP10G_3323 [Fimbriimonas ginsengisoli Gsoil 348]